MRSVPVEALTTSDIDLSNESGAKVHRNETRMGGHLHLHISYLQFEELGRHIALCARSTFTFTVAFSLDLHLTIHYLVSLRVRRRIDSIHGWHGV